MDWTLDYCLSCDRQIPQSVNGSSSNCARAYCSQSCHLADIERASPSSSSASSPTTTTTTTTQYHHPSSKSILAYLPPAIEFPPYLSSSSQRRRPSPPPPVQITSSTFRNPKLYNSSSISSLSSVNSYNSSSTTPPSTPSTNRDHGLLSEKVRNELREYAGSFDHIRDWKRRMTVV